MIRAHHQQLATKRSPKATSPAAILDIFAATEVTAITAARPAAPRGGMERRPPP